MTQRKTVNVEELKDKINGRLAIAELPEDSRRELCNLLESVLMATNNYAGYSYINGWRGVESYQRHYN